MSVSTHSRWERWVGWVERWRYAILLATAVLCLGSAVLSLAQRRVDLDLVSMLPSGTPVFEDFKSFVVDFGQFSELTVLVEDENLPAMERFADEFANRLSRLDTVQAVHVKVDLEGIREGVLGRRLFNYLPVESYQELSGRLTPEGISEQLRRNEALLAAPFDLFAPRMVAEDPLGIRPLVAAHLGTSQSFSDVSGHFVAPDGKALLIFAEPRLSAFDTAFTQALMQGVREAEASARAATGLTRVRVAYTGSYVYALEDTRTLSSDVARYAFVAFAAVMCVFVAGYRSLRLIPFLAVPLLVTTLLTFACSVLLFEHLNPASLSFAAILYGLSVDSGIHFYTHVLSGAGRRPPRDVVARALAALARPNLAACLTTAAAFLFMCHSAFSVVRQLGLLTAVGMLITVVEFYTLYPALAFALLRRSSATAPSLNADCAARLGGLALRRPRWLCAVVAVSSVFLAHEAVHVGIDPSLDHMRPGNSEAVRVATRIASRFGLSEWDATVLVHGEDLEAALIDGERVDTVLRELERAGIVSEHQGINAVLPSVRTQRARLQLYESLPRERAVNALRAELRTRGFALEPFAGFLQSFLGSHSETVRFGDAVLEPFAPLLARHIRERDGTYAVAIYVRSGNEPVRVVANRLAAALPDVSYGFASRSLLQEELGVLLGSELRVYLFLAVVINFFLLLTIVGNARDAAAILAPTLFSLLALLAGMKVCGVTLDPINLMTIPLVLGLGVDNGVYVYAAAHEHGRWDLALRRSGRALIVASLSTIAGFGVLALSRYPALAGLGVLVTVGLSLCLMASVTIVPAFVMVLRRKGQGL